MGLIWILCPFALLSISFYDSGEAIDLKRSRIGNVKHFTDYGLGGCGTEIDASYDELVSISSVWFTAQNINRDPYCTRNICVKLRYGMGPIKTIPVRDICHICGRNDLLLSKPVFDELANNKEDELEKVKWMFVKCPRDEESFTD